MYITAHVYSMPKGNNIVLPLPIISALKCSQQKEVRRKTFSREFGRFPFTGSKSSDGFHFPSLVSHHCSSLIGITLLFTVKENPTKMLVKRKNTFCAPLEVNN